MNGAAESRFEPGLVSELDEPVRRYFTHALRAGAPLAPPVRLTMEGRIKAGAWMPFEAEWQGDGRSFEWRARVGRPFRPLLSSTTTRTAMARWMFGSSARSPWFTRAARHDALGRRARGGRGRDLGAREPAPLAGSRLARAEQRAHRRCVRGAPERPELHVKISRAGAVRSVCVMRWDDGSHGRHCYIPCGEEVQAERRFGDLVLASDLTVGWWFDTPPAGRRSSKHEYSTLG